MTQQEVIKEIENNIKPYVYERRNERGLYIHITKNCSKDCKYFDELDYKPKCKLFFETLNNLHTRLPQCLHMIPEAECTSTSISTSDCWD